MMPRTTRRAFRPAWARAAEVVLAVAAASWLAACRDREPLAPPAPPAPRAYAAVAVACEVEPGTGDATCGAPSSPSIALSPAAASRAASLRVPALRGARTGEGETTTRDPGRPGTADAIIGGQGSRLVITLGLLNAKGRTVDLNVEIRNLLGQPFGTTNGLSADSGGVKLVFDAGPTVVAPQSYVPQFPDTARVDNAAIGNFTGSNLPWVPVGPTDYWGEAQTAPWPFFLRPGGTGLAPVKLYLPQGATRVSFRLLVVAAVPDESDEGLTPDPRGWEQVAIGAAHACAIRYGGALYCWGDNSNGQLGAGMASGPVTGASQFFGYAVTAAALGNGVGCVVGQTIQCSGLNTFGQAAGYPGGQVTGAVPLQGLSRNVAVGNSHACAVMRDSVAIVTGVSCWGDGSRKQMASTFAGGWLPDTVVAGVDFTCGLKRADGTIRCWGRNDLGQSSGAPGPDVSSADAITLPFTGARGITAGDAFACALSSVGGLNCWGDRRAGQLGPACEATPCELWPSSANTVVSAGAEHACVAAGSTVKCWGANDGGQVGSLESDPSGYVERVMPVAVSLLALGRSHSCATSPAATSTYCWGSGRFGALGNGSSLSVTEPTMVLSGGAQALVAREYSTCAVQATALFCWGRNAEFFIPGGESSVRGTPQAVGGAARYFRVAAGRAHTCALRVSDSTAVCWGEGSHGALGTANEADAASPTPVTGGRKFVEIVAGDRFTCAIEAITNTPLCWGDNRHGQLGRGFTSRAEPSPAPISGSFEVPEGSVLYAGRAHACLKGYPRGVASAASCWGRGDEGQLGTGTRNDVVTLGAYVVTQVTDLALGDRHTCALAPPPYVAVRMPGGNTLATYTPAPAVVRCTGANDVGQLGLPTAPDSGVTSFQTVTTSGPFDQELWADAASIVSGAVHTCAASVGGSIWCWGAAGYGRLANTVGDDSKPGAIPTPPRYTQGVLGVGRLVGSPFADVLCAPMPDAFYCWGGENRFAFNGSSQRGYLSSWVKLPPP